MMPIQDNALKEHRMTIWTGPERPPASGVPLAANTAEDQPWLSAE
jgi:hypothetical protein